MTNVMERVGTGGDGGSEVSATPAHDEHRLLGAVARFFTEQMTSPRPDFAMKGLAQRSASTTDDRVHEWPAKWLES